MADGLLSISNPRNGKIGIYISTMCHVPVDEIEMSVAVDQDKGDWEQVDYLTYHFYPEAGEDGIEEASVDYELPGHEANQYYRLRGFTPSTWAAAVNLLAAKPAACSLLITRQLMKLKLFSYRINFQVSNFSAF